MRKFLALLALIVSVFTLAACGTSHDASSNKNPTTMIGEWRQVNSDETGWMSASISDGSIQVDLRGRDSSSIFWMGSFETSHKPTGKFKIVSIPDADARYTMDGSLMASDEKQKTFSYDHGVLSFEFSALGSTATVHMTKTKSTPSRTATKTSAYKQPKATKTPARRTPKSTVKKTATSRKTTAKK